MCAQKGEAGFATDCFQPHLAEGDIGSLLDHLARPPGYSRVGLCVKGNLKGKGKPTPTLQDEDSVTASRVCFRGNPLDGQEMVALKSRKVLRSLAATKLNSSCQPISKDTVKERAT